MVNHASKNISIITNQIRKPLLVTPCFCCGLKQFARVECVEISDFAYGEYLFFIKGVPTYYINAINPRLEGTKLKTWIDDEGKGEFVDTRMLLLFRVGGIEGVSLYSCPKSIKFPLGKSYTKQFDLFEVENFEFR